MSLKEEKLEWELLNAEKPKKAYEPLLSPERKKELALAKKK